LSVSTQVHIQINEILSRWHTPRMRTNLIGKLHHGTPREVVALTVAICCCVVELCYGLTTICTEDSGCSTMERILVGGITLSTSRSLHLSRPNLRRPSAAGTPNNGCVVFDVVVGITSVSYNAQTLSSSDKACAI
jgi:hypothetical protein